MAATLAKSEQQSVSPVTTGGSDGDDVAAIKQHDTSKSVTRLLILGHCVQCASNAKYFVI